MSNGESVRYLGSVALAAVLVTLAACEKDKSTGGNNDYFGSNPYTSAARTPGATKGLSISPVSALVTNLGATVAFAAADGVPPYRWHVQDGSVGEIKVTGPDSAVYTALRIGRNYVELGDSDGANVSAAIAIGTQGATAAIQVSANPTSLGSNGDKSILSANGGKPPYVWTVIDASLGHIVGASTGTTVVYMRDHNGNNVVTVTDGSGSVVHTLIAQP